jgi:hypothetical protein
MGSPINYYSSAAAAAATTAKPETLSDKSTLVKKRDPVETFSFPDERSYSVYIEYGTLEICDQDGTSFHGYKDRVLRIEKTYMLGEKFYMALRLEHSNAYMVCCFDRKKGGIETILRAEDPHFLENRLIDFGTGCNKMPGGLTSGNGCVVFVYDLESESLKEINKIIKRSGNWSAWVDEENKKIVLQDQFGHGGQYTYSIY